MVTHLLLYALPGHACSAKLGQQQLACLMQPILETLGRACSTYGRRNLRMLYDALSTLADMVGRPLAQPDCIQLFMPPLLQRWQTTDDTDRELLPLLEVFTTIAQALGTDKQGPPPPPPSSLLVSFHRSLAHVLTYC